MHLPKPLHPAPHHSHQNRRLNQLVVVLALLVFAIGWAVPSKAASNPSSSGFEQLRQQELRVANVMHRLAVSNRKLCQAALKPQLGFVLHSLEQYGAASRAGAANSYGLGQYIGVMAVAEGSAAAKAGLVADDQLVSVNGNALVAGEPAADGPPTRAFVERAQKIVLDEMEKGEVTLRVVADGGVRDIRFSADLGCASDVELVSSNEVNAWADGSRVMVTDAIVDQSGTDDDLALVVAHELAHNILRHRQRLALAGVPDNNLLPVSPIGSAKIRETEEEADQLAVRLASAAGYDLSWAASFLNRLIKADGLSPRAGTTHPEAGRRLALLSAAIGDARRDSESAAL